MRKAMLTAILGTIASLLVGCSNNGNTTSFRVHTIHITNGVKFNDPGVPTDGFCGNCGYVGNLQTSFPLANTDTQGYRPLNNVAVPGFWNLARYGTSTCQLPSINKSIEVAAGDTVELPCNTQPFWSPTPNSIDVNSPPPTVTVSGEAAVSATNGTPSVDFYDETGQVIGSILVNSIASDGTSVGFATPSFLLNQYSGLYGLVINNINPDGTPLAAAAATIGIYGNDPPPPPPPDCEPNSPHPLECQPSDN